MPDFVASLLGALVGAAAAIVAAWIAYRTALETEKHKAERTNISDLLSAAYDLIAALNALDNGLQKHLEDEKLSSLEQEARLAGRTVERLSYMVIEPKTHELASVLSRKALKLLRSVLEEAPEVDFEEVRMARVALAQQANAALKTL